MMGLADDLPVTLVIKAPNQRMADHTVECQPTWTIKKLKQHLETVYPSKPKHNEQRLIYSGRLLQDHLTLKEILRQYDETEISNKHTVHLVCSTQNDLKATVNTKHSERNPPPTPSSSRAPEPTTTTAPSPQNNGLRYRANAAEPSSAPVVSSSHYTGPEMYYYQQAAAMGQGMTSTEYSPEQYMAMQQQLYSHYMMQYWQYYQGAFYPYQSFNAAVAPGSSAAFFPQAFLPAGAIPPNMPGSQPAAPAPPQAAPHQAAAANNGRLGAGAAGQRQNVRMNAQGGMEEDEEDEEEPRDWLHHTYFLMRLLAFMGILFFYSNVTRFLVVFTGSFAIYFLQKLRKIMQRRAQEQQRQAAQEQANNQQNAANQQQQDEQARQADGPPPPPAPPHQADQAAVPPHRDQEQTPAVDRQQQQQPAQGDPLQQQHQQQEQVVEEGRLARLFMFVCNTIQIFFTSLVPAPPELLDAN